MLRNNVWVTSCRVSYQFKWSRSQWRVFLDWSFHKKHLYLGQCDANLWVFIHWFSPVLLSCSFDVYTCNIYFMLQCTIRWRLSNNKKYTESNLNNNNINHICSCHAKESQIVHICFLFGHHWCNMVSLTSLGTTFLCQKTENSEKSINHNRI